MDGLTIRLKRPACQYGGVEMRLVVIAIVILLALLAYGWYVLIVRAASG